jgi:branched-chain amino acid aminotransferase
MIYTPPLSEGCVAGVMRRYLLEALGKAGYAVFEKEMDREFVQEADEVFLSNALRGIRWVQRSGDKNYSNEISSAIYALSNKSIQG